MVDTRMKRFSMMNMAMPHVYPILFEADGAVDADDRAFMLHLYGGFALGAAPGAKVTISEVFYVTQSESATMYITQTKSEDFDL